MTVAGANYRRPQWFIYPGWVAVSAISILFAVAVYRLLIPPIVGTLGDRILVGGQSRITEDFLVPYILWPTLSLANGVLQWLLLRRYLPRMGWWIVATTVGWLLALSGARSLWRASLSTALDPHPMWFVLGRVVLTGGTIGVAQWLVLRQRVRHAAWWIVTNVLGWGVSAVCSQWLGLWVFGAPTVATVAALWLLLDSLPRREGAEHATGQ